MFTEIEVYRDRTFSGLPAAREPGVGEDRRGLEKQRDQKTAPDHFDQD
jgi:hypothetical protein